MLRQSCRSTARYRSSPAPLPLRLLCFHALLLSLWGLRTWLLLIAAPEGAFTKQYRYVMSTAHRKNGNVEAGRRTARAPFSTLLSLLSIFALLLGCARLASPLPKPSQAQCLVQRPADMRHCQLRHRCSVFKLRTSFFCHHAQHAFFRSNNTRRYRNSY